MIVKNAKQKTKVANTNWLSCWA